MENGKVTRGITSEFRFIYEGGFAKKQTIKEEHHGKQTEERTKGTAEGGYYKMKSASCIDNRTNVC